MALNTVNDDKKRKNFRSSRWETEIAKKDKNKTTSTQSSTAADLNNLYKTTNQSSTVTTPVITEQPPSSGNVGMGDLKQAEYQSEQPGFFEQKKPLRLNDLYVTPSDRTKAPVYDYKRLDDKPITKKIYKTRLNDPSNREETFPIAQTEETQSGSILPAEDTDEKLRQNELMIRGETLAKINSGEIKLPPFVSVLPDNQKLQWVGATYNDNPLYTGISTISTPLINLGNVLNAGIDKVFDTNLGAVEPGNLESEDSGSKLLDYGIELGLNLLPLGASIKGANLLLKGIKSPYLRHMLSSGLGFMINSQPQLLDNLTQGKIELKDYAAQNAVDFGTGVTFGMLPLKTKLRYEIPYQSIVPTMVPVLSDIIQGKEVDSEKIIGDAITNGLLGLALSGKLKGGFKVKEVSDKVKRELKGYAEEQITPELVETVIAGYLPPASMENTQTVSRIDRSGEKPVIEQVETPIGRDVIQVDPEGKARLIPEKQAEPMITSETPLGMQRGNVRYDKQGDILPDGMNDAEVKETRDRLRKKVYPETPEVTQRIEGETELISEPENVKGVKITADPKAERDDGISFEKSTESEIIPKPTINKEFKISSENKLSEVKAPETPSEASKKTVKTEPIQEKPKEIPFQKQVKKIDIQEQKFNNALSDVFEFRERANDKSSLGAKADRRKNIIQLKKAVDEINSWSKEGTYKIHKSKSGYYSVTVDGKPLKHERVMRKYDEKNEAINIKNELATKKYTELDPVERETQIDIAEQITGDEKLFKQKNKVDAPLKVIKKGIEDVKEDHGKETTPEAQIVREELLGLRDNFEKNYGYDKEQVAIERMEKEGRSEIENTNVKTSIGESDIKIKVKALEKRKKDLQNKLKSGELDKEGSYKVESKTDTSEQPDIFGKKETQSKLELTTERDINDIRRREAKKEIELIDKEIEKINYESSKQTIEYKGKGKQIPKVPEKKAEFNAETEAKRREFEKMTLGQLERHIADESNKLNSRLQYEQTPEFKELVKPLYDKLTDQRMKRIKEEISFEKEKYQNKLITKDQYYAAKRSIIENTIKRNDYSNNIEDFGEKLGKARKDYTEKLTEVKDLDIATNPLSKVFPEANYEGLIKSGVDSKIVSMIRVIRELIPTKPTKPYKLRSYVDNVKMIREMAENILNNKISYDKVIEKLDVSSNRLKGYIKDRIDMYEAVGHTHSLKNIRGRVGIYTIFEGVKLNKPTEIHTLENEKGKIIAKGKTKEELINNLKEWYKDYTPEAQKRETNYNIYMSGDKYSIGVKTGRNVTVLKYFDSLEDARIFMNKNKSELGELLKKAKYTASERNEVNRNRKGLKWREGKDITPEEFYKNFNFRGVEFGNWVNKGKERQQLLNDTYDALKDLAHALNLPDSALSLNGKLGLGFGSRGKGGIDAAAAHFEPDRVIINLTRMHGKGSLAHEWLHALDNYFSRMENENHGYLTTNKNSDKVRKEVFDDWKDIIKSLKENTDIYSRSKNLDSSRSQPYWSKDIEVMARTFENYIIDKLESKGITNDFLSNVRNKVDFVSDMVKNWLSGREFTAEETYPYLTKEEITKIKPAFDKLFNSLKTEEIKRELPERGKFISDETYQQAIKNFNNRTHKIYSSPFDPTVLKDLSVVGLYHLERGLVKATDWARQMIKEFGEKIKPYLKKIWNEINDPKNVRKFREDNPEAKLFTSGIDKMKLREKDGEPETFAQYSVRIAKEYGRASTREEYQDAKEYYRTSKNQPQKEIKPESDDKVKQELKETLNDIERMRLDADRTKTSRPTPEEEIAKYKDKKNKKEQERNFIEKTIGKIPEYEEKYTGNEYDKQEKVTQEIRKNLFADENFKALNSDQKRKVVKAVDSYYKERNKNDMNFDNELGKEYKETLWNKAWKRGVKQAIKVVENMGEAGKEMASRFKKMSDEERKWMGKPSEMVLDLGKLSKEEYNNLKEIRTWKRLQPSLTEKESATKTGPQKSVTENQKKLPPYLNENVKAADKMLDDYYDSVASEFEGRGFLTKNKNSGKIYLFTPRRDYEPRVLNIDMDKFGVVYDKMGKPIHNIEREKVLTHMVQTGQAKNKADAAFTLDNYIAESRINKAGNIEYSRTFDFPEEYYLNDPIEVMIKYATRTSKRLAFSDSFGKDGAIADRLIDEMRNNMHDYKFVQDLYRYETGNLNASERQVLEYVNLAKGLQAMTKFTPFTTLRNSFQGLLGSSTRGNLKAGITGLMKAFVPAVKREAYLSGALGDNIESIIKESAGGDSNNLVGKMTSKYLNLIGFTASDRFNRVVSSAAGLTFYEDMLKRIANNSVLKKRAIREFQTIGLDPQEILSRADKKFTQEERNLIMRTFSGDTQFNIRPQDLPLFWSSGIGKLVTQWKPFGYKMTQLIRDSVWKETKAGNLFPLLTMMTAYGVAGESVNTVIDGLRSVFNFDPNKKDDSEDKMQSVYNKTLLAKFKEGDLGGFTKRLVDDLAGLGAMTMMVDILRSFGWGKSGAVGVVAGPTVGEITQTADDILRPTGELFRGEEEDWFNNTLKGVYNTASRNIPGSGILRTFGVTKAGRDALFKKKTTSDEFKETLNDDELKKYEEINSLTKKRDNAKKKAIETNDQKDKDEYRNLEKELAFIKSKSGNIYGKKNKFDYEKKKQENKILNK